MVQKLNGALMDNMKGIFAQIGEVPRVIDLTGRKIGMSPDKAPADNATAFATALAMANDSPNGVILFLPEGTHQIQGDYDIDASKVRIWGHRSTLKWTSAPSSYGLRLYSSALTAGRHEHIIPVLQNLTIEGGTQGSPHAARGVLVGDASLTSGALRANNVTIQGFEDALEFTDNAWRVCFEGCQIRWGNVRAPDGLSNTAENNQFRNCLFGGTFGAGSTIPEIELASGFWLFDGCSFDNAHIRVYSGPNVVLHGCHLENPSPSYADQRFASVEDNDGQLMLRDCVLVLNRRGTDNFEQALFEVDDSVTTGGLIIDGLRLFGEQTWFFPENESGGHRLLVKGTGRARINNIMRYDNSTRYYGGAWGMNSIYNAKFDRGGGSLNGWGTSVLGSGTAAHNASGFDDAHACLLNLPANNDFASIYQEFAVQPGRWVVVVWRYNANGSSAQVTLRSKLQWYDYAGNLIQDNVSFHSRVITTSTGWVTPDQPEGAMVPQGAAYARWSVSGTANAAGGATVLIDDVVANVM